MAEIRCNKSRTRFVLATDRGWWYLLRSVVSVDGYDPWPPDPQDRKNFPEVLIEIPESAAKETAERFGCGVTSSSLLAWVEARKAATAAATAAPETDPVGRPGHYLLARGSETRDLISEVCDTLAARGLPGGAVYEIGSALKYLTRLGAKGAPSEDLGKAIRFLEFAREGLGRVRG